MKKLIPLLLVCLLLSGCTSKAKQYQMTYLTLFDTVTVISGFAYSEEAFTLQAEQIHDQLYAFHQLFDIYNDYSGINNLKTVNDHAGIAPVEVDPRIISLLNDCKQYYSRTYGCVNVAMGSVLSIWHEARSAGLEDPSHGALPDTDALQQAARHTDWDTVLLDEEKGTVFITDPDQSLDVGAVAKGWALQQVAKSLPTGLLINLGGNVCATGPKDEAGTPWTIAVNDPQGGDYLLTLQLSRGSAVTSGDYQRYYTVDGVDYHHIIDPHTLMPATYWSSVTVICDDSGLADCLSTALFLMPREEGQQLLDGYSAEAMWVDKAGNCYYSPGFDTYITN